MAGSITNISEITSTIQLEDAKELTFTEELQKRNKIKYNLGILYFAVFAVMLTALFL